VKDPSALRNKIIGELRRDPVDMVAVVQALDDLVEQLEAAHEALRHASSPGPYCKGGTLICEICVGSCGVEEHDELVEAVSASSPASTPNEEKGGP